MHNWLRFPIWQLSASRAEKEHFLLGCSCTTELGMLLYHSNRDEGTFSISAVKAP
jgi:hypothetical protein